MNHTMHNKIVSFIWGIADDVLRDIYVRGKYRDVILPMIVIRRLDAVLEPTKQAVLKQKQKLDELNVIEQDAKLRHTSGEAFYNISPFTLASLRTSTTAQRLKVDFKVYLNGFSPNVREILDKFKFRHQIDTLIEADVLGYLLEKFLDPNVNLCPRPIKDKKGNELLPALDNHTMGMIFEELIRRFNEENNEEAGEHFTPRDVVELMADLIFLPIADKINSGTYLLYDGACGTGGMLTVAEERLRAIAKQHGKDISIHLYGQEIQPETYAITKADLLLKGEGEEAENMKYGSTLSSDEFINHPFDFMLSNPPYGKSWKSDLERLGGKEGIKDSRFIIQHKNNPEYSMITRSSDGQLMFLVNKLIKMQNKTKLGSRIAQIHNGSALFTGDAGQGESNIRRWIMENDWLEAIIALPENIFYNTGIATYIWLLTNRKSEECKGKVQLIDASEWFTPLRKNLGKKNCSLSQNQIYNICDLVINPTETTKSKLLPNKAFGYYKVMIERPLKLIGIDSNRAYTSAEIKKLKAQYMIAEDETGIPVIKKIYSKKERPDPLYGLFEVTIEGESRVVEYEPDAALRDSEQIGLLEEGGIEGFFKREVLPYVADAWISKSEPLIGYEISFTRHFYKPIPMRTLDKIKDEIYALEQETDGLLKEIVGEVEA